MQIAWIKKTTLLDYPWQVACLIFTPWCNLKCHQCYNPEFVDPKQLANTLKDLIDEKSFFNFLHSRKNVIDWVVICGWEPTLQKDLYDFIKKIKDLWFLVKLDTNGQDPKLLEKLIKDNLLDYVAMDIKHTFENYYCITWVKEDIDKYKQSVKILINSWINYEFRTTIIKWFHSMEDIKKICNLISWAKAYFIQNFIWWNTLNKNFVWEKFSEEEMGGFLGVIKESFEECWVR